MRPVPSEVPSRAGRFRGWLARRPAARLAAARRLALEGLEPRQLLASGEMTAPQVLGRYDASNQGGVEFQPTIAVDPTNPLNAAVVYSSFDPTNNPNSTSFGGGRYTTDGGVTWRPLNLGGLISNPATTNPVVSFNQQIPGGVAFDRSGNLYVVAAQYPGAFSATNPPSTSNVPGSGAIVVYRYGALSSGGGGGLSPLTSRVVYEFVGADAAVQPTIAVDNNLASFTDVGPGGAQVTQKDPYAGNVYVGWVSVDTAPAGNPLGNNFNPNRVEVASSSDGGQTFTTIETVNDSGNVGAQRNGRPVLAVSQGTADGRVTPGQLTVAWTDTGTLATADPARNIVKTDGVTGGGTAAVFAAAGGPIFDAVDPGNSQPHIPAVTDFPISVNITDPKFAALSDLDVAVSLTHQALNELSIELIAPDGTTITLVSNQTNAAGQANAGVGISGANLGIAPSGQALGTIFDDQATRDIVDIAPGTTNRGAAAPFVGHFRPEDDRFGGSALAVFNGLTAAGLNGTWTLRITDFRNSGNPNPAPRLVSASLNFRSGLDSGLDTSAARPLANLGQPPAAAGGAAPITPAPALASDNTLGAYSPNQGRLYLTYVDRIFDPRFPTADNNSDIVLKYSDDGGASWQFGNTNGAGGSSALAGKVNDDLATQDGFSEDNSDLSGGPNYTGRPQFQPQVAVDQATGTLVMSWLDTRYTADRSRPTYFVTYSVDGGDTFGPQVPVNPMQTATDAATNTAVNVTPIPDNFNNAGVNTPQSTGLYQGLAVAAGRVYPAWSSNLDAVNSDGTTREDIRVAPTAIPAGPRVIASTMGPIGLPGDAVNNTRTADGTPIASAFDVTFDRPVDPASFTTDQVRVYFTDTLPGNPTGGPVPVVSVEPLDAGTFGPAGAAGATTFRVHFAARSAVGTYSYVVGPGVKDRIRESTPTILPGPTTTFAPVANQTNLPIPSDNPTGNPNGDTGGPGSPPTDSAIVVAAPAGQVVRKVTLAVTITHTFTNDLILTLIAPDGTNILLSNRNGTGFHANGQAYIGTVFDDAAARSITSGAEPFSGSYRPQQSLSLLQGRDPNGTWTLRVQDAAGIDVGTLVNWSLTVQTGTLSPSVTSGNVMDQNGNGVAGEASDAYAAPSPLNGVGAGGTLAGPYDQDTLPLILPGPHVASSHVPNLSGPQAFAAAGAQVNLPVPSDSAGGDTGGPASPATVSTINVPLNGRVITGLTVTLNVAHGLAGDLTIDLVGPDGTTVRLANRRGAGANFTNTTFSDQAASSIAAGAAPFTGTFRPEQALSAFNGKAPSGTWSLVVRDASPNFTGTLLGWSLQVATDNAQAEDNAVLDGTASAIDVTFDRDMDPTSFTPADVLRVFGPAGPIQGPFTVTPAPAAGEDANYPRTYRIGFPTQQLSGTYSIQLAPAILSKNGTPLDTNLNAGVDLLLGRPTAGTTPVTYNSGDTPAAIPDLKSASSTINVPDNYVIQGVSLTLNIQHPRDADLSAYLLAPDGVTKIQLFTNVGALGTQANFTNTTFSDQAGTLIQNGGPPFNGTFKPQQPLGQLVGRLAAGAYTLVVTDSRSGQTGTLVNWSLTFQKPLPASGVGEPAADRATVNFRIFTMDPTNPLSSSTWTAVGPASIGASTGGGPEAEPGGGSGRIGGLAVDPSDPSGNTVYVAGASGGIWKTTNFLDPDGPTYQPLTDFGPTSGVNMGGLAVFPRNGDPNQSIIFGATGEGDTGTPGVGFIRSMDGGATWELLDSLDNTKPLAQRTHDFVKNGGTQSFKIVVDPKPGPGGNVIVYAAVSGNNGGLWRSLDSGLHWTNMRPGQATDVVLDPNSGQGGPGGNLQIVYAAFRGEGVFLSPNQGQVWNLMAGGVGDPLIIDQTRANPVNVAAPAGTPNGNKGRIVLAKPFLTGNVAQDLVYQGWLYAAVVTQDSHLDGLYMTKDFGQNWTKLRIATLPPITTNGAAVVRAVPTNDAQNNSDYDIGGGPAGTGLPAQGNYDVSLAIDPTNPNIVYLGGTADGQPTGFIRVDATFARDAHNLVAYDPTRADAGALLINSAGAVSVDDNTKAAPTPYINLIRDPAAPFVSGATIFTRNANTFANDGAGVTWKPFDIGGTDQHRIVTMVDPLTGHARLIIGDDQGVFTAVDNNGTMAEGIGNAPFADGSRNGNLQITQFYYGAAQPSNLAAQIAQAYFYGSAQDNGGPTSSPDVLQTGNISWGGPGGDAAGVATDQQGSGTLYQFWWPCCGGGNFANTGTEFFRVNGVARTFGLIQASNPGPVPDPQWPSTFGANFAVNPLRGGEMDGQVIISSNAGRIFSTSNAGRLWTVIGNPDALDSTYAPALAYGAPDPNGPNQGANLNDFLYAGTSGGHIFVTQTGGGGTGNAWVNISAGLDGSQVQSIITNPARGSHEAYAVTAGGVYHIADSLAAGATWENITSNLTKITHTIFGAAPDPSSPESVPAVLTSIVADWRYAIPDDFANPTGPTHPMLYVSAQGGVFRSADDGATWSAFPSADPRSLDTTPNPPGAGGGLPVADVRDLDLALGNIDPTTGRPDVSTGPNLLLASTYGRGSFAIRLAPYVFPASLGLDPNLPAPGGSDSGPLASDGYTNVLQPIVNGLSEESAFGNVVTVNLLDLTPARPGIDPPLDPSVAPVIGTVTTDPTGHFTVQVNPGVYKADGSTDGPKLWGIQAVNASGTKGNVALVGITDVSQYPTQYSIFLDTTAPDAPSAPALATASDTGLSQSDNITRDNAPTFTIAVAEANTTVTLYRDGTAVATRTGPGAISDPGPVADGTHVYRARQVDLAGNVGPLSDPLTVVVDTVPPAQPPLPVLDPADDSGVKGDGLTNVRQPRFDGTAEPGGLIQLVDLAGNVVGSAPVLDNGTYVVQPMVALANGTYSFRVRAEDVAGNLSTPSGTVTITVRTTPPAVPTIGLLSTDDSGDKGDNITNVRQPHLTGTATPGVTVQVVAAAQVTLVNPTTGAAVGTLPAGTVLGSAIAQPNGQYSVQVPSNAAGTALIGYLGDQVLQVNAVAVDAAGNTATSDQNRTNGTPNDPLQVTIKATPPAGVPTVALYAADDTGTLGDNRTTIRQPRLTGTATPGTTVDLLGPNNTPLGSAIAGPDGKYTVRLASALSNGTINVVARARDVAGNLGTPSAPLALTVYTAAGDFDGDGKADRATFNPTTAVWTILKSAGGITQQQFGAPGDVPLTGDFDGDGKADYAVYRPSNSTWYIIQSRGGARVLQFGQANVDLAVPGDYDGDGVTDIALYRPTTAQWIILNSSGGARTVQFGQANVDVPMPADFDGDGKTDLSVFRPTTGTWLIFQSTAGAKVVSFGQPDVDVPMPADYDGDGKADLAVYRPTTSQYLVLRSRDGGLVSTIGRPGDVPVAQDYDGDGKADLAVYRPSTSQWVVRPSSGGNDQTTTLGSPDDIPVPSPYSYRRARSLRVIDALGGSRLRTLSNYVPGGPGSGKLGV